MHIRWQTVIYVNKSRPTCQYCTFLPASGYEQRSALGVLLGTFIFILRQGLSLAWGFANWLGWSATEFRYPPVSTFPTLGLHTLVTPTYNLASVHRFWRLNSSPHTFLNVISNKQCRLATEFLILLITFLVLFWNSSEFLVGDSETLQGTVSHNSFLPWIRHSKHSYPKTTTNTNHHPSLPNIWPSLRVIWPQYFWSQSPNCGKDTY